MSKRKTDLERFACRVETAIKKAHGDEGMVMLICRLLTGKDQKVAAILASKWVSWRYGEATQKHEHTGAEGGPIAHTIRFGNGSVDQEP